jgi:hypothetical protein
VGVAVCLDPSMFTCPAVFCQTGFRVKDMCPVDRLLSDGTVSCNKVVAMVRATG